MTSTASCIGSLKAMPVSKVTRGRLFFSAWSCAAFFPSCRGAPDCVVSAYLDDLYDICRHADTGIVRSVLHFNGHIDVNTGKLKARSPAIQDAPEHVL